MTQLAELHHRMHQLDANIKTASSLLDETRAGIARLEIKNRQIALRYANAIISLDDEKKQRAGVEHVIEQHHVTETSYVALVKKWSDERQELATSIGKMVVADTLRKERDDHTRAIAAIDRALNPGYCADLRCFIPGCGGHSN